MFWNRAFVGLFLLTSVSAFASVEDAEKVCQSLSFASEKINCLNEVHKGTFYQASALSICKNFSFSREKMECLGKIRNKTYTETLIETCKDMTFSSKIMECLAQFGSVATITPAPVVMVPPVLPRPIYPPIGNFGNDREERRAKKAIKRAMKLMDRGEYFQARRQLEQALSELRD